MCFYLPKKRILKVVVIGISIFAAACGSKVPEELTTAYNQLPEEIDFNFHIRPILSDRCFACHGPDEKTRKGDLRLDTQEGAFSVLKSGNQAFLSGKSHKSEAIERILSKDEAFTMPPPEANLTLSDEEKALLIKWVEQGAKWKEHWAYNLPEKPAVPESASADWKTNNEIDYFIHRKLKDENLIPSPQADKERLLRRIYLDLIGLPPSIEAIDSFIGDKSEYALENVIDGLLENKAFGERMALNWMDVSRYADSHGMHADGWRSMWPWRDWVIDAFNNNMPFDQFIKEQLAGDLMPNPTKDQILATAFNRNHPMTAEGGVIDEEFRLEYVADRTNTVATALLGMTMECARCHDHKFDPISQKEYYQLSAFFNNVNELGMTGDDGNYGPAMYITQPETDSIISLLNRQIKVKQQKSKTINASASAVDASTLQSSVQQSRIGAFPFDKAFKFKRQNGSEVNGLDGNKKVHANEAIKLVEGKFGNGVTFNSGYDQIYLTNYGNFQIDEPFTVSAWIKPATVEKGKSQQIIGNSGDKNKFWRGWEFIIDDQMQLNASLIHKKPTDLAKITSQQKIKLNEWTHVAFRYKALGSKEDLDLFINGVKQDDVIRFGKIERTIFPNNNPNNKTGVPLLVGKSYAAFTGNNGIFKDGILDEINLFNRALSTLEINFVADPENIPTDQSLIEEHYQLNSAAYKENQTELASLLTEKRELFDTLTEVMVIADMPQARKTHVLNRGAYDQPGEEVLPGTPSKVLAFDASLPKNRLGLAEWMFDKKNPLTARVAVNRYWQLFMGRGLVKTLDDFGSQGALPSHPELLDWLTIRFQESGYDIKALCKLIVSSATYQQSSKFREDLQQVDPENIYLAKASSYRLPAELIRDVALFASGLLHEKVGGKSVKPYQPEGLWIEKGNFSHVLLRYKQDEGNSLYRKSLYTFIRRTSPPPFMSTFDAPGRDRCTMSREITNTPLQALVLLNDPQFVEAAKVLSERVQAKEPGNTEQQIILAFRLVTGRTPDAEEINILTSLFDRQKTHYTTHKEEANKLLAVGEATIDPSLDPIYTAALTMVSSTLLNHDEMYTKR